MRKTIKLLTLFLSITGSSINLSACGNKDSNLTKSPKFYKADLLKMVSKDSPNLSVYNTVAAFFWGDYNLSNPINYRDFTVKEIFSSTKTETLTIKPLACQIMQQNNLFSTLLYLNQNLNQDSIVSVSYKNVTTVVANWYK